MPAESNISRALAWAAFAVAFSPVLADLVGYFAQGGHQGAPLLAAPLILLCAWHRARGPGERSSVGLVLLGLGVGIELLGIAADAWSVARMGLPTGFVGMALWRGAPALPAALLACFVVPVPVSVLMVTTPWLEAIWADVGASVVQTLGGSVSATGPLFRSGGGFLELTASDAGLPTAAVLTQLGWYAGVRRGHAGLRLGLQTTLAGAGALIVQPVAVVVAVALLVTAGAEWARGWLDWGLWIILAGVGIVYVELRTRRGQVALATDRRA